MPANSFMVVQISRNADTFKNLKKHKKKMKKGFDQSVKAFFSVSVYQDTRCLPKHFPKENISLTPQV